MARLPLTRTPLPAPQLPGSPLTRCPHPSARPPRRPHNPAPRRGRVLAAHKPSVRRQPSKSPGLSSPPGAHALFCEKPVQPARELPCAAEGRLPEARRYEGRGGGRLPGPLLWDCTTASGMAGVPVVPLRGCGQIGFGGFPRAGDAATSSATPAAPRPRSLCARGLRGGPLAPVARGETGRRAAGAQE
ncbi:transcription initiation factor TFIID subunit 4-like [Bubalus bubalis]|uniref:transcription initiation factor TFIID subunit 4-like n=1 Tax=Bubalus bubalis TaxID=89462 RepID=UPI000DBC6BC7|nr:transcription initiation factor TFIID subunit 4-like [Bubalus bubalis]